MTTASRAGRRIVHVVRSDSFAVERYICCVASELSRRGYRIHVIGGDPDRMRAELEANVDHDPAASTRDTLLALSRKGHVGIVHAHMTAAEVAAIAAWPRHRAPIVATRHFPARRGQNRLVRPAGDVIRHALAEQIAISRFVASRIGEPSVLVHNGVAPRPAARRSA